MSFRNFFGQKESNVEIATKISSCQSILGKSSLSRFPISANSQLKEVTKENWVSEIHGDNTNCSKEISNHLFGVRFNHSEQLISLDN
jgi:hypothetical protein